jgi:hypothetical protein
MTDSGLDEYNGRVEVEGRGPQGLLQAMSFARDETVEGLNGAAPVVVRACACSGQPLSTED